jgi:hypothetical protein
MSRISFLPSQFAYLLIIFLSYALLRLDIGFKILFTLLVIIIFYFFRRASVPYRDTLKNNGEIYLSPIHGVVESIRLDTASWDELSLCHEVRVSIGPWCEKGLYLPTSGEVSFLRASGGSKVPRKALSQAFETPREHLSHTDLILTSKNQAKSLMRFIDCPYGQPPVIWLKSGDRGRGAACFGYYPLGGTLIIYLPQNSDILVFQNERLVAGQSVIAALKDIK